MGNFALEVQSPEVSTAGSPHEQYRWRVIDVRSHEIVLSGEARTRDRAIQDGLALARLRLRVVPAEPAGADAADNGTTRVAVQSPTDVVQALLPRLGELPTVQECGSHLVQAVLSAVRADAVAVLLRDQRVWSVIGGESLRPLEQRSSLNADHWLVETVCIGQRSVVINDTDIARQRLAGAPLASRRNVMAVPLGGAEGLLIMGRISGPPFDSTELARVTKVAEAGAQRLAEARQVRLLARALRQYAGPSS